ncbi:MAG: hypothetical protein ACI9Z9_002488, partial [Litorivivens sp.]
MIGIRNNSMFVEIRSYHYDPTQFYAYKKWALDEAVP